MSTPHIEARFPQHHSNLPSKLMSCSSYVAVTLSQIFSAPDIFSPLVFPHNLAFKLSEQYPGCYGPLRDVTESSACAVQDTPCPSPSQLLYLRSLHSHPCIYPFRQILRGSAGEILIATKFQSLHVSRLNTSRRCHGPNHAGVYSV